MIRVAPAPVPDGFEDAVERPGKLWLLENPTGRPKDLWSPVFRNKLADAFDQRCGYAAMYEPVGTVDHFVSCTEDRSRTYDWTNYRFASQWLNSSKFTLLASQVIDPFEVDDTWFEILLPSLQLILTDAVPAGERERAQFMLDRLHLGHDERILRQRRAWYRLFTDGKLTLEGLEHMAPLIARAVRKQLASEPG